MPLYVTLKNSECRYLPKIYSVDIADGRTVVTEEFISGKDLLSANPNEKQVIRVMVQLCAALDFIHGLGIVHRDIKPSNILLGSDGNIRLIDFEAARFLRGGKDRDTRCLGTDGFAPPEQYGFSQTDFRTDIYAAGQTMKTLLGSLSAKKKYAKIIRKCTALDPAERYQSARELSAALTNKRKKISVSAVLAAAAAVLLFAAFAPKEVPTEDISYETGIVTEAKTTAETTAVSETEASYAADTVPETDSTSATTAADDVSERPPDMSVPEDVQELIDKYDAEVEAGLTYYGVTENLPDYDRSELLFFPEDENAKILFTDGKAFFDEHRKFYMYYDMDGDGVNEAIKAEADQNGSLEVFMVYGVPDGEYSGLKCFWSEYLMTAVLDESCLLQVTGFEIPYDGRYVVVTVGDGESFNVTEIYAVREGEIQYIGCGRGETEAVMNDRTLNEYFADGRHNEYMLYDGRLSVIDEYEEY